MGKKKTKEEFIQEARDVHGDKYDYSKVEYVNNHTKVCILCPKHGEFEQNQIVIYEVVVATNVLMKPMVNVVVPPKKSLLKRLVNNMVINTTIPRLSM